ncbi:MAG: transglycosylase SLT domain-containing protein [Succinivibrionaceae bacterium]
MIKLSKYIVLLFFVTLSTSCVNATNIENTFNNDVKLEDLVKEESVSVDELTFFNRYKKERSLYLQALESFKNKDIASLNKLLNSNELADYPLFVYLKFQKMQDTTTPFDEIKSFVNDKEHIILSNRIKAYYIAYYTKSGEYKKVLELSPNEPVSPYLQCYWYDARLHLGDKNKPLSFIKNKYRNGDNLSQPCLSLARDLYKKKLLTKKDLWERYRNSYWTRNGTKVNKETAKELKEKKLGYDKSIKILSKLYDNPHPSKYDKLIPKGFNNVRFVAFSRYARMNPLDAYNYISTYKKKYGLTKAQENKLNKIIISVLMYRRDDLPLSYIDQHILSFQRTDMIEQRIRIAIWMNDYTSIIKYINHLPQELKNADNYKYWLARSYEATNKKEQADILYREVAEQRSFYGFITSKKLGMSLELNDFTVSTINLNLKKELLNKVKSYARFQEFEYLSDNKGIQTEWQAIMQESSLDDARVIATIEANRGYQDLGIWESIYKKDWDVLSLRFPIIFKEDYEKASKELNVPLSYLLAITRQESMMNPLATSPVGARGLMQIMPSTAKNVAKKYNYDYKNSDDLYIPLINIKFGATYLHDLLDSFNGNRIFATAGYNAGPSRSVQWKSKDGKYRDMITYIESIPFNETRNYVQKVLFYEYIYQNLLGIKDPEFLSELELNSSY